MTSHPIFPWGPGQGIRLVVVSVFLLTILPFEFWLVQPSCIPLVSCRNSPDWRSRIMIQAASARTSGTAASLTFPSPPPLSNSSSLQQNQVQDALNTMSTHHTNTQTPLNQNYRVDDNTKMLSQSFPQVFKSVGP